MGQDGRVHLHLKLNVQSLTSHYVSLSVPTAIVGGIFLLVLIVLLIIGYKMRRSKNKYVLLLYSMAFHKARTVTTYISFSFLQTTRSPKP